MKEERSWVEDSCDCQDSLFLAVTTFSDRIGKRFVLEQCQRCGKYRDKSLGKVTPPEINYYNGTDSQD